VPLRLPSLELKRLPADLVWCYKIIFDIVDMPVENISELALAPQPEVIDTNY